MIRYPITLQALEAAIDANADRPKWLSRAASRTQRFRKAKRYAEKTPIWSEVKAVYMRLQGDAKCAYCERKLESVELGRIEQDVEHFRPKGNVRDWSLDDPRSKIRLTPVAANAGGYYLLPYHIFNYAAACKPCNSALKSDRFPIAGTYQLQGDDPVALFKPEAPYLIYPIGDLDTDPEELIEFYGISPRPVKKRGHARNRALVTIAFFSLDDCNGRKNLVRERAALITGLFPQLKIAATDRRKQKREQAQKLVDAFTSPKAAHTNCARSFKRVYDRNPAEAEVLYDAAFDLIVSIS
jgi:hypothetical protein